MMFVNYKMIKNITDEVKLQVEKFFFQKLLTKEALDNSMVIESLWFGFCSFDKIKFINMSKEKQHLSYFTDKGFNSLANTRFLKQEITLELVDKLGIGFSQNYGFQIEES